VLTRSLRLALDKIASLGTAELACDKPRSYRLAPGPDAAGDPGTSAESTASAAITRYAPAVAGTAGNAAPAALPSRPAACELS
jgi:hypothetical protein